MKNRDIIIVIIALFLVIMALSFIRNKKYSAILHTGKGDITVVLNSDKTPKTVNNFITLSKKGFYNNTIFHRVIRGFMIQGGDPKGDGTGGPGYRFDDEPFEGEYTRGTIAMANSGPNTNGSQFFIMHKDYPLPKDYVIFGKVAVGLNVLDAIAESPVSTGSSGEISKPVKPVKIMSIEIIQK
ncbi:MAG: Peptidyl-prolyl cis-trans isomerase [Candidatus Roizmanbacteria bacterium GW2011_GWA2_36_23]|uniref:Peptidyl-prolyl cis-trans isomerase n=1 Tax=Candidatus Roizmanbacteria bacterium GW2011_GWA2_36_23 TaxID=1618480 RepID=A0A0G0GQR6_9BACT|nr:MAG: Peptidyl-prolyl cis-trans isomerase [Candidatus Roizmanbacteria bacterium GW2011_GWA2_36_23]